MLLKYEISKDYSHTRIGTIVMDKNGIKWQLIRQKILGKQKKGMGRIHKLLST